jgi:hypothetical protein
MPRRELKVALGLATLAFAVYNANLRPVAQGDSLPARYQPLILWHHGTLYLDPLEHTVAEGSPRPYWIVELPDGRKASLYPVVTPLLVAPLYLPGVAWLNHRGWTPPRTFAVAEILEKLTASLIASASVALLYLTLRRRASERAALLLTLAYAFGTNTWTISSQALWQHGAGQLFVVLALWATTATPTGGRVALAGLAVGLLPANRPPDLLLALGFLPFAWEWTKGRRLPFLLCAALPGLATLAYNLAVFHHPAGGYGAYGVTSASSGFFSGSLLEGIAGLLVSPGRGLFVFSPVLLFLVFGAAKAFRETQPKLLATGLTVAVLLQIALYARTDWRAGDSWGYRFLTDLLPILIWLLVPIVESQGKTARRLFAAACLFSVWAQIVGAFQYIGTSDRLLYSGGGVHNWEPSNAWKLEYCPILVEARNPPAPRFLLQRLRAL